MATKTLLTIDQYNALEEPAGVRYELDRGELIVTPSPAPMHNIVCGDLHDVLNAWVKKHNLGQVIYEVDVKLGEDTVRRPDLMFFPRKRLEGVDLEQVPLTVVPELAVEVVSKSDQPDDLILKVRQYLQAGVKAVWLLYRKTREAYRYVPRETKPQVLGADQGDKFEEPKLLPGFKVPLSKIFR